MMKNDGGPAFPRTVFAGTPKEMEGEAFNNGLSLRDYFAAAALQGLCARGPIAGEVDSSIGGKITHCYRLAGAMLAERDKNRG